MSSKQEKSPEIKIVLKALNHANRRDILLYLNDLRRTVSFSELMDYLNIEANSSSQFSYHLKLLLNASLIAKENDRYNITPLGTKATSMLDLVDTNESTTKSVAQKINDSFLNLTISEQIIVSFTSIGLLMFFLPLSIMMQNMDKFSFLLIPTLLIGSILAILFYYIYLKLQYIPSLLVLTNIIWIVFLPSNQLKFAIMYLSSLTALIEFYQILHDFVVTNQVNFFGLLLAILFLSVTITTLISIFIEEKKISTS